MIYLQLFWVFFKIGAFTFGGGYAMLPLIREEVEAHCWLTGEELLNFVAVCESTPGPIAVNVSTYVGMDTAGILGAFCSTIGVVLPSFIIIVLIAKCFQKFQNHRLVKGAMSGLKPAVVGLIGSAVITTAQSVFFSTGFNFEELLTVEFVGSAITFISCLILAIKKVHPIIIILVSAICGIIIGYIPKLI